MQVMKQRIFHPIGQGAYYSERHQSFNIVFDCGNWKNTNQASRLVKGSFESGDVIEYLFISHFDYDHVNKIKDLKDNFEIRNVVLPLMHDNQRVLLRTIFACSDYPDLFNLIGNPEEYFGEGTSIIYVASYQPTSDKYSYLIPRKSNDDISNKNTIQSGSKIKVDDWMFIPYNIEYFDRSRELEDALNKVGVDLNRLISDTEYMISVRKQVKEAYKMVSGDINENSLILYSGPINKFDMYSFSFITAYYRYQYQNFVHRLNRSRVGCIYTGDANLNVVDLQEIFSNYWDSVGVIQIPHHGDYKSFNKHILRDEGMMFPISVGSKNTYGHPSNKVLSDILFSRSEFHQITEKADSILFQNITRL